MKKLLVILSALALSLSLANAQLGDGSGDGDRTRLRDGSGTGGMWDGMGDIDLSEYPEVAEARSDIHDARETLRASREVLMGTLVGKSEEEIRAAVDAWKAEPANIEQIKIIRSNMEILHTWFRDNRPDRPDPIVTDEMTRRRLQFRTNTQAIRQLRQQLEAADPDSTEFEDLKAQLRTLLQEQKQLMRRRRAGGGEGGDRRSPEG